jgi:hypothetical protein
MLLKFPKVAFIDLEAGFLQRVSQRSVAFLACLCAAARSPYTMSRSSARAHADDQRTRGRARAQKRLPVGTRQQLLDAIYSGQPFRRVLRDLGLTSNQVWGPTRQAMNGQTSLKPH